MSTSFVELLKQGWQETKFLCVGLDTDYRKLPTTFQKLSVTEGIYQFNKAIIDATAEYCLAFKPNTAFYEGYGIAGMEALQKTNEYLRANYPGHVIILDAKRADIGNTNLGYVKAAFEVMGAHAITVHPYLGEEALHPFLKDPQYGVIVLCHTSNPGAGEFQELEVNGKKLYQVVAHQVATKWNLNGNCGLVVGATYPDELEKVRRLAPDLPLLIPGIGAQGGDLFLTVAKGLAANGQGIMVNASRSILYASYDKDFATAAATEAKRLDQALREAATQKL